MLRSPKSAASWQQVRRAENRERLLDAGAIVFARSGYLATTIEEILVEAALGRTSFYKHFADKLAIAAELFARFMPFLADCYAKIADHSTIDKTVIHHWLDTLIDAYASNRGVMKLFAQVAVVEPRFAESIAAVQHEIMTRLAARFEAFAAAAEAPPNDPMRTRASMLLNVVDHLCSVIALQGAPLHRGAAIDFVTDDFSRFVSALH